MELLIHPHTQRQLEHFLKRPVHALLIEGLAGSGKGSLAASVAARTLGIDDDKISHHPFFLRVEPVKGTISIDTVRSLQEFIKLKTFGKNALRRAIVVENAQAMTIEAQNAFLKLLEEPPSDTIIILTATPTKSLLPTIYSRVQRIHLKTPEKDQLTAYFKGHDAREVEKAFYMSGGQPGLMTALLVEDQEHTLSVHIAEAKEIIRMSTFERLTHIDQWTKQRDQLGGLLMALGLVCQAVLVQAVEKNQTAQIKKSHQVLKQITLTESALSHNPNLKLLLTDLMLHI